MKNLMKKIRKNNKGFTLVELIIVIAVIAILTAVAAPQYIKYVERSRQGVDASTLQEVKHIVEIEAGTTEGLDASGSTVVITVASKSGTLSGTASFNSASGSETPAFKNIQSTVGALTFKSAKTDGTYTLNISDVGVVSWESTSATAIAELEKGTKS